MSRQDARARLAVGPGYQLARARVSTITIPAVHMGSECPEVTHPGLTPKSKRKLLKPASKNIRGLGLKFLSTNSKRKRGIFPHLPVELLIEVAKHLSLPELIQLSRVNKSLHELFLSRQTVRIWRSAQQAVPGLPPCPEELCEPQYAALLFTKWCSICGKKARQDMDPILLVRLCVDCHGKETVNTDLVSFPWLVFASERPPMNQNPSRWCLYSDAEAVEAMVKEFTAAGKLEAKEIWMEKRLQLVQNRYQNMQPLVWWLKQKEDERKAERGTGARLLQTLLPAWRGGVGRRGMN
ncbi:Protein SFI1 [Ceratobasidium theobromae]|uniref:Protein SFI1 n=1 Tax=Ceratobasidium theobromae TaxID=1582974 RepID=A0A5N5QGI8_9AGAM|nr:Protein SFI1 [Ceratobasidium theobromae]